MSNIEQKQKILLKRTTEVDKQPIPSGASHGELFLNIASGANAHNKIATMQIGTNEAIIWSDDVANEKKFALKTEVEALVKEVEDNELVTATAISTMNASAGFNEDGSSVLEGGVSLSEAIIELQNKTQDQGNYASKTELENLIQEVEDSEFVTANALTQINKSAGFTEGGISKLPDQQSLTDAIIELQGRTSDLEESDPIFAKSAASGITSADITNWNNKMDFVDRVSSAFTSYSATTSTKAIQDGDGNVIATTYSTKEELSGAVNDIIEEIIDNELVTSTAISTMNASAGFNEDGTSALPNKQSLTDAIVELQNKTQDLEESDPIFTDSPAAGIKLEDIENWNNSLRLDSPVIKGTATNSAVLNGTYLGRDNQAISQLSMAAGAGANAGLKGYYYEGIDFTNKKIYLSNKTTLPTTIKTSGFDTYSNFSCGYSVEDVISIVNGKKYDRCSKITAISNNVITLDSLPFTQDEAKLSLLTDTIGEEIPNEFSVNVVKRLVDDYDVLSVTKHNVGTVDLGGGAHAEGVNTFATNIGAHAEGFQTLAYGQASHAEGMGTQASYTSHAEGYSTQATGDASHAEGKNTIASGDKSHAEGYGTRARGHHSHAEGVATIASGTNAHAEGDSTTASGYASHAEGISTIASGTNAHAEGELAQAIGNDSHAEGYGTQAIGSRAHAEGDSTQAIGKDSHAGGNGSIAEGDRSFAHGDNVRASGANALALGKNTIAAGHNSIAAGHESQTNNTRSFAMGYICKTEGNDSMAFGYECSTAAAKSAAIGNRAKSTNIGEFACGSYNATGDTQLFSVGCGTSDTSRKNAFHITNSNGIISAYVNNKKISTEDHKHSGSEITGGTISTAVTVTKAISATTAASVVFSGIPTGKTNTTVARGDHSHTAAELGLESALKYHGVTTTPLTDGATTKPITIGGVSHYQSAGCVVIYTTTASGDTEFVWNGSSWEKLGDGINYKVKQEAVSDPAANGSALSFIDTISQDTNGVIKPTKKSVNLANYSLTSHTHNASAITGGTFDTGRIPKNIKVNSASTADSATKLQTPRTLWGQSFDGTADVSGAITLPNNTPINVKNSAGTSANNALLMTTGDNLYLGYGTAVHNGSDTHIWGKNIKFTNKSGQVIGAFSNDKLGIGVENPSERLDVSGNIKASGNITAPKFIGTATSATKLQTPRTLWGNDFDGSANIGGDITLNALQDGRQLSILQSGQIKFSTPSSNGWATSLDIYASDKTTLLTSAFGAYGGGNYVKYAFIGGTYDHPNVVVQYDTGNVGIGTINPEESLHVSGTIKSGNLSVSHQIDVKTIVGKGFGLYSSDTNPYLELNQNGKIAYLQMMGDNGMVALGSTSSKSLVVNAAGFVSVNRGYVNPTEALDVGGNIKASGNITAPKFIGTATSATTAKSASTISAVTGTGQYYLLGHSTTGNGSYSVYKNSNVYMNNGSIFAASDRTLKTHIEDIDGSLDKIKKIPKVYFHWNNDEDKKRQMGTYAQDLEEVYPELVTKDKDGIRAVAYDRLGVVALAGIDKLYDMVQELMKKNDELEKRIKELEENK